MNTPLKFFCLTILVLLFSSCASILSDSTYPVNITSNPDEATVSITDRDGVEIFNGKTPCTVSLDAGAGFFKKAKYQIRFAKNGYEDQVLPVDVGLDGWYWGNLLLGGVIGMLIVDPATGAMYEIEDENISATLRESGAGMASNELKIFSIDDIPEKMKKSLIRID